MVSTAIDEIQHPNAAVDINDCFEDMAVAINAIKESPAPVTSKGFTDKAGMIVF